MPERAMRGLSAELARVARAMVFGETSDKPAFWNCLRSRKEGALGLGVEWDFVGRLTGRMKAFRRKMSELQGNLCPIYSAKCAGVFLANASEKMGQGNGFRFFRDGREAGHEDAATCFFVEFLEAEFPDHDYL